MAVRWTRGRVRRAWRQCGMRGVSTVKIEGERTTRRPAAAGRGRVGSDDEESTGGASRRRRRMSYASGACVANSRECVSTMRGATPPPTGQRVTRRTNRRRASARTTSAPESSTRRVARVRTDGDSMSVGETKKESSCEAARDEAADSRAKREGRPSHSLNYASMHVRSSQHPRRRHHENDKISQNATLTRPTIPILILLTQPPLLAFPIPVALDSFLDIHSIFSARRNCAESCRTRTQTT